MILTIDVGNSTLFGGVFKGEKLLLTFRRDREANNSADEFGLFFRSVIRENGIDPAAVKKVGISSVVPNANHSLRGGIERYFKVSPFFLQVGVKTGLKIRTKNPPEVGSDRIANSIAAVRRFPKENLLIVDFGTATTVSAVNADGDFLGASIMPGLKVSMEALFAKTARLPAVEIIVPESALGKTSVESIQSGLYFGQLGAIKELSDRMGKNAFHGEEYKIIGTGGFSGMFTKEQVFDQVVPELVLEGVKIALQLNEEG